MIERQIQVRMDAEIVWRLKAHALVARKTLRQILTEAVMEYAAKRGWKLEAETRYV